MKPLILFLAGDSDGCRRSAVSRLFVHASCIHADIVLREAGPSYFPGREGDFSDWSFWIGELQNPNHHDPLYSAVFRSMTNLAEESLNGAIVVQGAIVGHPLFRVLIRDILRNEISASFHDAKEAMFWLDQPLPQVWENAKATDPDVTIEETEERLKRYQTLMSDQPFERFTSTADCVASATSFLLDESENTD